MLKYINVLLMGETGVGKSTFINSIINYSEYHDWDTAKSNQVNVLIPSQFNILDKNYEEHQISIGETKENNEVLRVEIGASATQDVKTCVFPLTDNCCIRLIDTPGMGDIRGIKQDDINCERILDHIGSLDELHAICLIFRPNNTRITAFFTYCINQVLSRLEKSASTNIIFVFTNSRGSDYGPGETLDCVRKIVDELKLEIPVKGNIFCFDNEPFRFLAARQQGVIFNKFTEKRINESWGKSSEQWWKLLSYTTALPPHKIQKTLAVNEARRIILKLAQPLADVTQLIKHNMYILTLQQNKLNVEYRNLDEIRKHLHIPDVNIKTIKLTQPALVCTNKKCLEVYHVGGLNKCHLKTVCQNPCYLDKVPKQIIGGTELLQCSVMNETDGCSNCGCSYSVHMQTYYSTQVIDNTIANQVVEKNIKSKEDILQQQNEVIQKILETKKELEYEQDTIIENTAMFSNFLQNHAIIHFNDSCKEYAQFLIHREKSLGKFYNTETVKYLEGLLTEYDELKKVLNQAAQIQKDQGKNYDIVTPQSTYY